LGDVMKESAQTALSYVRAHAAEIGAPADFYEKHDIHIHKDVMEDLPDEVRAELDIHFVRDARQVLELTLEPRPGAAIGEKGEEEPTLPITPKKEKARRAPAVPKVVPEMPGAGSTLHCSENLVVYAFG
jgi:Lon protease (S16) C-terminal proteolytic domain